MIKNSSYIYRAGCTLLCTVLLLTLACIGVQADTLRSYKVTVDHPVSTVSQNTPAIIRDAAYGRDSDPVISGWIKADQQMSYYLYTLDGGKTWIRDNDAVQSREDVKSYCPNTYRTAGFRIVFDVQGLIDGVYDIFVRGITEQGDELDVLAMLNVKIGDVDTETATYRQINPARLGAKDSLTLSAGASVDLGAHNLGLFERVEILSDTDAATLTLSCADQTSPYHFTKASVAQPADGGFIHTFDLSDVTYAGNVTLHAEQSVTASYIRLYYNTPDYYTGDLVIHMTLTPYEYLGGMNRATATLVSDDTVGTYVKMYPTEDTDDPYVYFNISSYLKDTQDVAVSADHYRYAVITAQTPSTNSQGYFRLFLCAGAIRGPSGNSHIAFKATNDGNWHRYIIPLHEEDDWTGQIHGMRFDFIDNHAVTSDYANIASVGFYPDYESAQAAAAAPFEIFHEGSAPVDKYKEEGRAPSGLSDMITWFDDSLTPCFTGENKVKVSFNDYGHLLVSATENTNDPYVSFDLQTYSALSGTKMLSADKYKYIVLRIMADKDISGQNFTLYYYSGGLNYAEGTRSVGANFKGEGWEYLVYDMTDAAHWTQNILGMRLDVATQISAGQTVCISDMLFFTDESAWLEYATQHGIETEQGVITEDEQTTEPVTEAPTIEIPTQGPELEYIPPEQNDSQTQNSCQSLMSAGAVMLWAAEFVLIFAKFAKKGENS